MKCLCHSAHLCASHACEQLPRSVEDLVRDIYSHFSHSAKRLAEHKQFQAFTNTEPHKLLKHAQTHWLSLEQSTVPVLGQWQALEEYFKEASESSRLVSACTVYVALKNPIVKLYYLIYQFLKFVLPKFTNFNKLFQSEMPNIQKENEYAICLVGQCTAKVKHCENTSNLLKHLKVSHPSEHQKCIPQDKSKKSKQDSALTQIILVEASVLSRIYPRESVRSKKLDNALIEMIATDLHRFALAVSTLLDPRFKKLIFSDMAAVDKTVRRLKENVSHI